MRDGGGGARGLRSVVRVDDRCIRTGVRGSVSRVPRGSRPSTGALVSRPLVCSRVSLPASMFPQRRVALRTAAVFRVPMMTVARGPPRLASQRSGHHVVIDDVTTIWSQSPAPTPPWAIASLLHENGMEGTAPHPPAYVRPKDQRPCLRLRHGLTGFTGTCRRVQEHTV